MSIRIVVLVLFVLTTWASCQTENKEVKKPNVLIILTDDLGYGDISSYGQNNYLTPHIDNIAEHGVSCTDFYVPTPYCAPSRATLLTGRFPLRHGLVKNPHPDGKPEADTIGISSDEILISFGLIPRPLAAFLAFLGG